MSSLCIPVTYVIVTPYGRTEVSFYKETGNYVMIEDLPPPSATSKACRVVCGLDAERLWHQIQQVRSVA